ncbi:MULTISPECIES: translation initiation factor IF-2 [Arcicella]|uniref:Translation initiation factor IF-2 n=1 Tax=Arcicella lustrica TaxID=2984196 RepID=A0ABU5SIV4_9BACT|nr:translation initiation factor IF-2 [Arcicella sp. DC25W]MEA5427196.1 translation initiation factor IF-2 [Arcicella sp. DC25W]
MAEDKMMRLSLVAKQINVGTSTIVQYLSVKGHKVENNPNAKLNFEQLKLVAKEYGAESLLKDVSPAPVVSSKPTVEEFVPTKKQDDDMPLYFRGKDKADEAEQTKVAEPAKAEKEPEVILGRAEVQFKVLGKIELDAKGNPVPQKPVIAEPKPEPKVEEPEVKIEAVKPEPKPEIQVKVEEVKPVIIPVVTEEVRVVEIPKVEKVEEATKPEPVVVLEKPVVIEAVATPIAETKIAEAAIQPSNQNQHNRPQGGVNNNQNQQNKPQQGGGNNNPNQQNRPQGGGNPNQNPQHNKQQGSGNPNQNPQQNKQQGGGNPNQNQARPIQQGSSLPTPNPAPQPQQQRPAPAQKLGRNDEIPEDTSNVELIEAKGEQLKGLTVLGKISLPVEPARGGSRNNNNNNNNKKKRKRIDKPGGAKVTEAEIRNERGAPRPKKDGVPGAPTTNDPNARKPANTGGNTGNNNNTSNNNQGNNNNQNNNNSNNNFKKKPAGNNNNNAGGGVKPQPKGEVSEKQIQDQIKATMARLQGQTNKSNFGAKERRVKRKFRAERNEQRQLAEDEEAKILKVTEFISASELASLMDVSVNEIISTCMSLGMFVSINQRLEADVIALITEEFGFEVQFVSAEEEIESAIVEEEDAPEDLLPRAPIVTIMGHVDHGKTSLLDYIRRAKVAAGEAGGITQHIGAYSVKHDDGRRITFLDTPGHEAFTAMRARGAKLTDVAIIVIAADDAVMPQTEEAINHAMVAGVPIVFAFSKVDKPGANTEKIREQLSIKNMLVEEWGGKYQTQEISSKSGMGINELLEKVLLEAELLELKANANKRAVGAVIEASLDKGRGYVANIMVQAGTLKVGDMMLAGAHYGRVKAMFDYRGNKLKEAGPSIPVQVLGLGGAPAAGDKLSVMENERDAREIANKREQIIREQSLRTRKHITLDEIGRRKAIGTFKELNVIVKGDVDGSVEALSDSLLKLSTEEVQVRIIHKGVGQVSESDVLLASASDAVIVAFQVRPSVNARRLAENEQIEIRTYSIIYQAIDDVRDAMEGLLAPKFEEVVTANIEVRDVFKISKVGTVAGSYVLDGTVKRAHKIRVIRDFVVIHEGEISALKRFKDDVAEVKFGYECGLSIKNFNDLEVGDIIECYEMKELKRTL